LSKSAGLALINAQSGRPPRLQQQQQQPGPPAEGRGTAAATPPVSKQYLASAERGRREKGENGRILDGRTGGDGGSWRDSTRRHSVQAAADGTTGPPASSSGRQEGRGRVKMGATPAGRPAGTPCYMVRRSASAAAAAAWPARISRPPRATDSRPVSFRLTVTVTITKTAVIKTKHRATERCVPDRRHLGTA